MDASSFFTSLSISWNDIVDVSLVTLLFYNILVTIRKTQALAAVHGLLIVIISYFIARYLSLNTLVWILENILNSLFLLVVIVFQSDIRHALTRIGTRQWFFLFKQKKSNNLNLKIICDAAEYMAARKIGALIVIEGKVQLGDIVERGVSINAKVSRELLINLFWPNSPMHDGAVVIRDKSIEAGGCILPLSNATAKRDYGTRHRAALGVTEQFDAVVIVVSEERGVVSISLNGKITEPLEGSKLLKVLTSAVERRG